MIEIRIKTNGIKILDNLSCKKTNLTEVSIVLYRLEQIKKKLIDMEFKSDFEVREQ